MHPRQTNEQPLYTETLWEWRAFGEYIEPNLQRAVRTLQKKSNKSTKFQDQYLWIPNCDINLKLRGDELRIKQLLNSDSTDVAIQQWMTQAYQFPVSVNIIKRLVGNVPDIDLSFPELLDQKMIGKNKFLSDLQTLSIILKQKKYLMLTVKKDREMYIWYDKDCDEVEGVTIEIAKISEPEMLYSISLEHHSIKSVKSALSYLNISVDSHPEMKPLSYLEVIEYWFDGRRLY
ncbi:MAG TPA: hypothetical protein VH500_23465 [Nitrososphaeraceae archaeon]|jgi:hypothetical protein